MSINIRSITSNHGKLAECINEASYSNVPIKIIALQETWTVHYPDLISINNYRFIHKHRPVGRGGGVGFYIRDNVEYKILNDQSAMIPNIFECLTIEANFDNRKIIIASVYRSPNPPPNMSSNQQIAAFNDHLGTLMQYITRTNKHAYICLDSNINAHAAKHHHTNLDYFTNIYAHGFIQLISTSTRVSGNSVSLIDHILTNSNQNTYKSGVIISDLSDHFPTFTILHSEAKHKQQQYAINRNFSHANIEKFKETLSYTNWEDVYGTNDVNISYDNFWKKFSKSYNECFPIKKVKFNKNLHRKCNYMTQGLLNSRRTKLTLLKKALHAPTQENINQYRQYRNRYNTLVRLSKKTTLKMDYIKQEKIQKKLGNF